MFHVDQTRLDDEVFEAAAEALELGALALEAEEAARREGQLAEMMLELPEPTYDAVAEMEARGVVLVVGGDEDDFPY